MSPRFGLLTERSAAVAGVVLNVDVRARTGSGGARDSRNRGMVPGVLYGGRGEPANIEVRRNELVKLLRSGKFVAHMVTLDMAGRRQTAMPKAIQYHPVTEEPIHIDLWRVDEASIIDVEVPVRFINEAECPGLKRGGTLNVVRHAVGLHVPAGAIPEEIVVDLAGLEIGAVIHISAVSLPPGVTPTIKDRDFTVATIVGRGGPAAEDDGEAA